MSIVLCTKLLSHDLNPFWCVRLPSCDAKSMLNVAPFLRTAVANAYGTKKIVQISESSNYWVIELTAVDCKFALGQNLY